MKWLAKKDDYRRKFAFIPVKIGDVVVWLEYYYSRFDGDCFSVLAADKYIARAALADGEGVGK